MSIGEIRQIPLENDRSATVIDLAHRTLLDRLDITNTREGGFIDCYVPAELIDYEEVPVKEEWAQSLATEMRQLVDEDGGTGQITPITLGYIEGEPTLKIIDGFHRDAALRINGEERRYATVKPTTWDKLYDARIFLAKDHVHVRFSRVVQWIREAWEFSGLSEKLSVEQAVLLYRFDTDGSKLHLDPVDVAAAKAWIQRKEEQWQMASMTIHSHLMIAANVDPALVHSTREKKDNRVLDAPTQVIIKIFSDTLPNDFPMQNLVMDVAKQHNLTGPQVKALCVQVKDCQDVSEAQALLSGIDPDAIRPEYAETQQRALRRKFDPRFKGATVLNKVVQDTADIRARVSKTLRDREPVDTAMKNQLREARAAADGVIKDLATLVTELTVLIGDRRPSVRLGIPEQRPSAPDPFKTVIHGFLDGTIDVLPPIDTPERLQIAESLLELDDFMHRRTPQGEALYDKIVEARARRR